MRVFYHCYGSSHTSVVAAALHTGRLDPRRTPTVRELCALPLFDRVQGRDLGTVFPAGRGPDGEEVFVVGFGPGKEVIRRAVVSFLDLKGVDPDDYMLVDALRLAGWLVKVGGTLSRRLGLVSLGRPMAALGMRRAYPALVALVREVRGEVARRKGRCGSLTAFPPRE
ncbi:MAG: DUF3189 family protein [Bacillota bacterium]